MNQTDYEFATKYSPNDLKLAARLVWKKKAFRLRDILISLLIIFGCLGTILGGKENIYSASVVGLSILLIFWGVRWLHYRKILRKMRSQAEAISSGEINVILSSDSIIMRTPKGEVKNLWKNLTDVWDSSRVLFLIFGSEYIFFPNLDANVRRELLHRIPQNKPPTV